jgi:hypothetical protein
MLGPQDLGIALAFGVFFFGAKKLPELSRSLGQAMKVSLRPPEPSLLGAPGALPRGHSD